jgi:phosphatidylserine decarboxylase
MPRSSRAERSRTDAHQAKGLPYRLDELFDGEPRGRFQGGTYLDAYLAPKDTTGSTSLPAACVAVGRWKGALACERGVDRRHATPLRPKPEGLLDRRGDGRRAGLAAGVVLIGATRRRRHRGRWLSGRTLPARGRLAVDCLPASPGDPLGVFEFGSTVVRLVGGTAKERWTASRPLGPVKVGERLGAF